MPNSPYNVSLMKAAATMTATAQTSPAIALGQAAGAGQFYGGSFAMANIEMIGTALTTATIGLLASVDGGVNFFPWPINLPATPTTLVTTATITANAVYQANLSGVTHLQFVTSGTFTATNLVLNLALSPNGMIP